MDNGNNGDYRVELEVFSGPLDLLLYLIKKEEVDIYNIPIARITSQYLRYIEMMHGLNLEIAGEFVLMAATLIRLKARLLLPRDESDSEEIDPREELILALVEYKKFKEAGEILRKILRRFPCCIGDFNVSSRLAQKLRDLRPFLFCRPSRRAKGIRN